MPEIRTKPAAEISHGLEPEEVEVLVFALGVEGARGKEALYRRWGWKRVWVLAFPACSRAAVAAWEGFVAFYAAGSGLLLPLEAVWKGEGGITGMFDSRVAIFYAVFAF